MIVATSSSGATRRRKTALLQIVRGQAAPARGRTSLRRRSMAPGSNAAPLVGSAGLQAHRLQEGRSRWIPRFQCRRQPRELGDEARPFGHRIDAERASECSGAAGHRHVLGWRGRRTSWRESPRRRSCNRTSNERFTRCSSMQALDESSMPLQSTRRFPTFGEGPAASVTPARSVRPCRMRTGAGFPAFISAGCPQPAFTRRTL